MRTVFYIVITFLATVARAALPIEYSADSETGKMADGDAFNVPGMLADILVGDGSAVWMRL